jgi:hypothetical protein
MRGEIARLRDERDAAVAQARDALRADDLAASLRLLQQEVETLRREPPKPKKPRRPKPAPPAEAPAKEELPGDWYVNFQDTLGQTHALRGSTAEVSDWIAKGLANPARMQVSRSQGGPFLPLICVEDFRGVAPSEPPLLRPAPEPAGTDGAPSQAPAAARPRVPEWVTWVLMMVVALGGALLVGNKLFW